MSQRLQKRIAQSGITSRRKAEDLIKSGKVKVNGQVVTEMGVLVTFHDIIEVDGQIIEKENLCYYLLNKPSNVISSVSDEHGRKTVVDLIEDSEHRIFPVGRLDYHSTGLIILTNDGDFSNLLSHPSSQLTKEYHVRVKGLLTQQAIYQIHGGLSTDDEMYQPARIFNVRADKAKNYTHFDIVLVEGKNRQIRKMFKFLGFEVQKLHRQKIGPIAIGKLRSGEYRVLKPFEIKQLEKAANS